MGWMIEGAFYTTVDGFSKTAIGLDKGMGGIFVCNQNSLRLTSVGLIPDCGESVNKILITIGVEQILWEKYLRIIQA